MEQHNLYLPFLDIMINKDSETDSIWMDVYFIKKMIPGDMFHLTLATLNSAKAIYLLHLQCKFVPFAKQRS